MGLEESIAKLKFLVIKQLNLEDLNPEDIDAKAPLFGEGLGLDSIDALELIVLMDREYGIKINDPAEGKKIFISIEHMARFIEANSTRQ
jgi:acyl carrier protein